MIETDLANYFLVLSEQETPPIIELQNNRHEPVGALYLDQLRDKGKLSIVACEERADGEKYFLVCDGIAIFFSFFKKVYKR